MRKILFSCALVLILSGCKTSVSQAPHIPAQNAEPLQKYTRSEVELANSPEKCWAVIRDGVYDLTSYINRHPGGPQAILSLCGKDGTTAFEGQHGADAGPERELQKLKIGTLQP